MIKEGKKELVSAICGVLDMQPVFSFFENINLFVRSFDALARTLIKT